MRNVEYSIRGACIRRSTWFERNGSVTGLGYELSPSVLIALGTRAGVEAEANLDYRHLLVLTVLHERDFPESHIHAPVHWRGHINRIPKANCSVGKPSLVPPIYSEASVAWRGGVLL